VAKDELLIAYPHFVKIFDKLEPPANLWAASDRIVIPSNQIDSAVQAREQLYGIVRFAKDDVAQVVNAIDPFDPLVPLGNHQFVHFLYRGELRAEADGSWMVPVRICGIEDLLAHAIGLAKKTASEQA
jgi:hypothetical protein